MGNTQKKSASLGFAKIESQAALVFIIEGIAVNPYPSRAGEDGHQPQYPGCIVSPSPDAVQCVVAWQVRAVFLRSHEATVNECPLCLAISFVRRKRVLAAMGRFQPNQP